MAGKDYESRIVFKDLFSQVLEKYKKATKEAAEESENASKKVGEFDSALSKVKGTHTTKLKAVGYSEVNKSVSATEEKLKKLTNKKFDIKATAKVTHSDIKAAQREAKALQKELKALTGQKYKVAVDVGDKSVSSSKLSNLKNSLTGSVFGSVLTGNLAADAIKKVGGAAIGLGKTAIGAGALRQEQMTNMTHFLGGDAEKAQGMVDWAAKNASATQFSSAEVISATSRASQIADGDTAKAKRMVKLAEDMASLNPGKTISDAMEALADADVGEMERMKEFGMKISADDFKAAKGDLFAVKDGKGRTIEDVYKGGTDEGAQNWNAKIGTITGKFQDSVTNIGLRLTEKLAPALDTVIDWMSANMPAIEDKVVGAVEVIGDYIGNVITAVKPFMPIIKTLVGLFGTEVSVALQVVGGALRAFGEFVQNNVVPAVRDMADRFASARDKIESFAKKVGDAIGNVQTAFANFTPSGLWEHVKSWFGGKSKKNATGTLAFSGGWTQMNENMKGELVALPNGSKIYPHELTKRMLANELKTKSGNTNNVNVSIDARGSNLTRADQYRLRKEIVRELVDALDNVVPA